MAFTSEDNLCCPICRDIFGDPVLLPCSHSFCSSCVNTWWTVKTIRECPVCKNVCSWKKPPQNLVLKNLCKAFLLERDQQASEGICRWHFEKLQQFCVDHHQPVCAICMHSETHSGHKFRPIAEVAQESRENLQRCLNPLQVKVPLLKDFRFQFGVTADHIDSQARRTKKWIRETFKRLYNFLAEEEQARLAALREEEERKTRMIIALIREIDGVIDTVRASEEELRAADVLFLQNYKAAVERIRHYRLPEDPQQPSEALIDQAKHLGNLSFNIWSKMKDLVTYTPVILDPNTANLTLYLSEGLTGVRQGVKQKIFDNPERFNRHPIVLSSEGFNSGTHRWDVEVGEGTKWVLGVSTESVQRKEDIQSGVWGIACNGHELSTLAPPNLSTGLCKLETGLRRIRVELDLNKGKLSFTNLHTNTNIHTYTHTFNEKVFAFFDMKGEMKILPMKVSVRLTHDS